MKKILSTILCSQIFLLPVYAEIQDDFISSTLDKNLQIQQKQTEIIRDDFVETTLNQNLKIKQYIAPNIEDIFAESNSNKNAISPKYAEVKEDLPILTKENTIVKKAGIVDFSRAQDVKISIKNDMTTQNCGDEGSYIEFVTLEDNIINKTLYPKGTTVRARIENVSMNKSMGVPSELIVGNFALKDIPLHGQIEKTGANRSLWVYPVSYCASLFFGVGIIVTAIRGGHAKIKTSEVYTVQYIPQQ